MVDQSQVFASEGNMEGRHICQRFSLNTLCTAVDFAMGSVLRGFGDGEVPRDRIGGH
jgi:hypothetical protein